MRYKDCQCVSCNEVFKEGDDVVVCPKCGSPYHRGCWEKVGHCLNEQRHEEGFKWVYPFDKPEQEEKEYKYPETKKTAYTFKNGESAVICPHCKALNYGNDALCLKCRLPLNNGNALKPDNTGEELGNFAIREHSDPPESGAEHQSNDIYQQSYEFYQRFGGLRPETKVFGIPSSEYADYIGKKHSGKYIRRFATMERYNRKVFFSPWAFLFGPIWFLYRKMYTTGAVYLAVSLIIAIVSGICAVTTPVRDMYSEMGELYVAVVNQDMTLEEFELAMDELNEKYQDAEYTAEDNKKLLIGRLTSAVSFGLTIGMTIAGYYIYLKHVQKKIYGIREECNSMRSYRNTLQRRGGVSVGGAIIGIVATGLIYIVQLIPAYSVLFSSMQ